MVESYLCIRAYFFRVVFWQWFKQHVSKIWVRELTVERQGLRQVHVDFLVWFARCWVIFNCLLYLMLLGSDVVGFWCFEMFIAWCGENCFTCATPCRSVNFCSTCANPFRSVKFCCTWATPECSLGIMFILLDSLEVVIWIFLLLSYCREYVSLRLYIVLGWVLFTHTCLLVVGFYLVFRYSE
jgi:hypothetical protein